MRLYESDIHFINNSRKVERYSNYKTMTSSILTVELENDLFWNYKNIGVHNYRSFSYYINGSKLGPKGQTFLKQENQTLAENFFTKTGVYLTLKDSDYLMKCGKERCLLDFSVQKSTIINNMVEESK
jgi:hypothetical protein